MSIIILLGHDLCVFVDCGELLYLVEDDET